MVIHIYIYIYINIYILPHILNGLTWINLLIGMSHRKIFAVTMIITMIIYTTLH